MKTQANFFREFISKETCTVGMLQGSIIRFLHSIIPINDVRVSIITNLIVILCRCHNIDNNGKQIIKTN